LDEVGLADSLEALLLEYKRLIGINYVYHRPPEQMKFQPAQSILFYRVTQELLNNMAKHSQAKNVWLAISQEKEKIKFSYRDDGAGFDPRQADSAPHRRKEDRLKLGLAGLKERVGLLSGIMSIDSTPGKGTRISVELPIT
jgi:signal transduction histidine kinase